MLHDIVYSVHSNVTLRKVAIDHDDRHRETILKLIVKLIESKAKLKSASIQKTVVVFDSPIESPLRYSPNRKTVVVFD